MNKIEIKLKSFDTNFINSTVESIENIVTKLGLGDIKQVFLK
jgi:ribosomal protein S10